MRKQETKTNSKVKVQKVRRLSIRFKLLIPVVIVILAVCSLLSMFAYMTVQEEMVAMGQMQAKTVASLAVTNLDAITEQTQAKRLATEMSATAAAQIQVVSKDVINAVNELATEAEKMIVFMDETAMTGYQKLLETSKDYQSDVGNMNQMMSEFAASSETLKMNVESIRDSVNSVNIAIEESVRGITNVSEATANITATVGGIGLEANANLDIVNGLDSEVNKFKLNE